jgi:hypothetical protein
MLRTPIPRRSRVAADCRRHRGSPCVGRGRGGYPDRRAPPPGGSTALSEICTVRSALVNVPVFSPHAAAGSKTSASAADSVRKMSWTTTTTSALFPAISPRPVGWPIRRRRRARGMSCCGDYPAEGLSNGSHTRGHKPRGCRRYREGRRRDQRRCGMNSWALVLAPWYITCSASGSPLRIAVVSSLICS